MRASLEQIITHADGVDGEVLAEIRRYTKLFWLNSGPHNNLTARKFVLRCTPQQLTEAARAAARAGATFPTRTGESIEALINRLGGPFFDPVVDEMVTNKTPGAGRDILATSANNLYAGVTMADLTGFDERYGLNSRLVKNNGDLHEDVWRQGGRYGRQIEAITGHLTDALPFATPPMRKALEALIKFYRSGEDADRAAYDVAWVADKDSPIDTI